MSLFEIVGQDTESKACRLCSVLVTVLEHKFEQQGSLRTHKFRTLQNHQKQLMKQRQTLMELES